MVYTTCTCLFDQEPFDPLFERMLTSAMGLKIVGVPAPISSQDSPRTSCVTNISESCLTFPFEVSEDPFEIHPEVFWPQNIRDAYPRSATQHGRRVYTKVIVGCRAVWPHRKLIRPQNTSTPPVRVRV
ncbi:unnamed protein product [Nesidiocoris tenuis]|uniref:Uncharacterized protein n=1 Tax=Nesidiocoris tenuis TaxID=355587 RepID=A0A6H5GYP7_9HEMI|nr:unnamed protein product [Nesidiocoris tenuis]